MAKSNVWNKEFILAYVPERQESIVAGKHGKSSRHGWARMLKAHILNNKHKKQNMQTGSGVRL